MFKNYKKALIMSIVIIAVLLGVLVSYLLISREPNEGEIKAVSKAKAVMGYSNFPDKPDKVKGIINGGGPYPGIKIPGEFETKVKLKIDSTYQVTFTEYWNSKDFKYEGSKDGTQSHFIIFEVKGNNVKGIKDGGDFSPEQVK
ncbi:hypothetical protein [Candidatus Clostridium radicumherbarum]|uniref:Uncharacterized protein n=1 Tax=Candidatus Clostridium radicumherbarum TaxID=3381662 RepID=A0ABW8TU40_9CLOT